MEDKRRALEALKKLAAHQSEQSGMADRMGEKAKLKMSDLGVSPESAAKSAALLKIIHDASQGRVGQDFGDFDIEGQVTPEEKRLKLGWKRNF